MLTPGLTPSEHIDVAVAALRAGKVVAFPTETVYGIGAVASNAKAVDRIFTLKGRPKSRPLIVHLHARAGLESFASRVPDYAARLAEALWPGPLTLVCSRQDHVLDEVTGGGDTVAVRVPDHPVALALIEALNGEGQPVVGVAAPSANRFGEAPATTAQQVLEGLGAPGTTNGPDVILDGGQCPGALPSTILSCVGQWPRLLRRGATPLEAIEQVVGRFVDQ